MKNIFKSFYKLSVDEYKILWNNALFVFDTNILLNLYRYQSSTKDEFLSVIEQLQERIWIPHHVALEFHRNRLIVIADQHKRYSEVRSIISKSIASLQTDLDNLQLKKRHSHINPDALINSIEEIKNTFFDDLEKLEYKSISLSSEDPVLEKIHKLFSEKVGKPIASQEALEKLFKDGEERFKKLIPPGFKDAKKDEKEPDDFTFGGLSYKRKFGDLIVWQQIIEYAKERQIKDLIFITDDGKADWWWKIESNGSKTIGARPELVDEINREAGVERFNIYNTENFLNFVNELLNAKVPEETIKEVREVSAIRHIRNAQAHNFRRLAISFEKAVHSWLNSIYSYIEFNQRGFPDFIIYQGHMKIGFEIKLVGNTRMVLPHLDDFVRHAFYVSQKEGFDEVNLILGFTSMEDIERISAIIQDKISTIEERFDVLIGLANYDEDIQDIYSFELYNVFSNKHFHRDQNQ